MFTVTNKLRTVIALGAVGAALGGTGVASAAIVSHPLGSVRITVKQQSVVEDIKDAGSAGVPGYDDDKCESLLGDYNTAVSYGDDANVNGDQQEASTYYNLAGQIYTQLSNNCLLVTD